ncbi:hypothetical protein BKP45_01700 [Anaerobacillus alkalidiazotrophicus]|uniref:DNA-binding response regulator n=1 Tax=Anaerobacillus alkalidiazotrophicus TaxID=472963 RepID=A0A1S2M9T9_9BACI|nr:helix-turn-helix domain-containing protein [Anaerobacillus alkalidiazotrophicus]OIJ21508.1 hypothetical protein BKP45_01700 [Anaerobacillus alkalidiazotrophicus]
MQKVVIADLEPIQRKCLRLLLEERFQKKIIVFETESGREAIQLIDNNNIDLLILDTRLVELDGITCTKIIKEKKPWQKIIVYTMTNDHYIRETFQKLGVSQYLLKPLRPKLLLANINKEICDEPIHENKRKIKSKVASIIDFIDSNIHEDLTLSYVAGKTEISSYYLSKVFKKETGKNFVTYVTERKIEKAKELLRNVEIPIINISFELGYTEPSYFTKVFKKVEGMTPSQYRNKHTAWS